MEICTIHIRQPQSDSFGASLQQLLPVLKKYNEVLKSDYQIMFDLSSLDFVHPFLILPVAALIVNAMETGNFFGFERCKTGYLEKLAFPSGVLSKGKIEP